MLIIKGNSTNLTKLSGIRCSLLKLVKTKGELLFFVMLCLEITANSIWPLMSLKQTNHGKSVLLTPITSPDLEIHPQLFEPAFLKSEKLIDRVLYGRGKVYFVKWHDRLLALRNYYRGGAVAKLSKESFLFTGLSNTRCYQELFILGFLNDNQVNVPKPIAAIVHKSLLTYRASIMTQVIEDAVELDALLAKQRVDKDVWHKVGQQIRKMHDLQVCHYDLNVKNILVQYNEVFLIDFDKCLVKKGQAWKMANIARLKRSLNKQLKLQANYQFEARDFDYLLAGYNE
jgi:3-deoxy-D-manno-octulosonic acid kinase